MLLLIVEYASQSNIQEQTVTKSYISFMPAINLALLKHIILIKLVWRTRMLDVIKTREFIYGDVYYNMLMAKPTLLTGVNKCVDDCSESD